MTRPATELRLDKAQVFADLNYEPHEGQRVVHESRALRRVLACGVRWGKTRCAAMEGIAAALEPRATSIGWIVAPTYDLADRVYREIQAIIGMQLKHRLISMKEHDRRILLRNLAGGVSEIRAKSADNPVSLLGEGLDWLVVDEAARLRAHIWENHLAQRLIDRRGWALLISTPRGKGWYFDSFRRGQGKDTSYESWNAPSWQNPHLDRELIEAERARLPERVFMQEFGGQFIEGSGAVFRNVRECATGSWKEPEAHQSYFAGLDLAKVEDFSVLVVMNRAGEVCFVDRFHRLDWALQVGRIRTALERYRNARVRVDSTGAGEPVFEALRREGVRAEPYPFTARSKAALIDHLALLLERREIVLPRPELWPDGIDELESFEYAVTETGHVKSSAPAGQHDDCVAALALAALHARPARSGRIGSRVIG
ncbi:MAG: hypothetical protein IPN34_16625 [Planctomycetes bacterium]|nr:hypothetical protein [Planctomycetota bacterium]